MLTILILKWWGVPDLHIGGSEFEETYGTKGDFHREAYFGRYYTIKIDEITSINKSI